MKTARKSLLIALCAILLVVASVMGTLAYLTSTSAPVTNTFTIGDVLITLDEAKVDVYGNPVDAEGKETTKADAPRVAENTYKLIPGHTYTKDPTIHVGDNSEKVWLFAKIENDLSDFTTLAICTGWTEIDATNHIYAYSEIVEAGADIEIFSTFTVDTNAQDDVEAVDTTNDKIVVTGYAIQADGLESKTPAEVWAAGDFS